MFLSIFLGVISIVFSQYTCPAYVPRFPVANIAIAPVSVPPSDVNPPASEPVSVTTRVQKSDDIITGFVSRYGNTLPAPAIRPSSEVVSGSSTAIPFSHRATFPVGINPILGAFINLTYGTIASNPDLTGLFNLHELPPQQLADAYFHTIENKLEVFHVPDALNISCVFAKTIGSVADNLSPPLYQKALIKACGTFLIEHDILNYGNVLLMAQDVTRRLQNALNIAIAAGSLKPHIDGLVNGSLDFISSIGISVHDHADRLAELIDNELKASKQPVS